MITLHRLSGTPIQQNTAVALGYFDGIHKGHRAVITAAVEKKKHILAPAVFTFHMEDVVPNAKRHATALQSEQMKRQTFEQMGISYLVNPSFTAFKDMEPTVFVQKILHQFMRAKVVCCGADFRFGSKAKGNVTLLRELCARVGIAVQIVPEVLYEQLPISSTRIRNSIVAGEIERANEMLGYFFTMDFKVIEGNKLGRKLQFPTINQRFPEHFTVPRNGVYASVTSIDGKTYPSVTNIGTKPTVSDKKEVLAETHVLQYGADLYGHVIPVSLISFIRAEQKFDGIEALQRQIKKDSQTALERVEQLRLPLYK